MISRDDVLHVAHLARIELTEDEITEYQKQLSDVLEYMSILNKAPVTESAMARATMQKNVWREDAVKDCPIDEREAILSQAPYRDGDYYQVPSILEN